MQLRTINKALEAKHPGLELVKGEGYFYFAGAGTEMCKSASVYVPRLNDLTFEQWMSEADDKMAEIERRYFRGDVCDIARTKLQVQEDRAGLPPLA